MLSPLLTGVVAVDCSVVSAVSEVAGAAVVSVGCAEVSLVFTAVSVGCAEVSLVFAVVSVGCAEVSEPVVVSVGCTAVVVVVVVCCSEEVLVVVVGGTTMLPLYIW